MLFSRRQLQGRRPTNRSRNEGRPGCGQWAIKLASGKRDRGSLGAGGGVSQAAPFPENEESKIAGFAAPRKGEHPDRILKLVTPGRTPHNFRVALRAGLQGEDQRNNHGIIQARR